MSMGMAVMMPVPAMLIMLVMMMVIAVVMRVIVTSVGVVRVMVMRVVILCMIVRGTGIGAALGIERRLDLDHAGAQTLDHRLDDVIAADAQAFRHDLRRQMTVAEMPGDPDQVMRVGAANLHQRLRRRDHFHQPAVIEHQRIAAAERDGVLEIEQEFEPARARHRHPPPMPVVEIEHDGVGRRFRPAMLRTRVARIMQAFLTKAF